MCEVKLDDGTIISPEDAERIYRAVDRDYHKQDVVAKVREEYDDKKADEVEADDDLVDTLAERFEDNLGNNEVYFDAMWETMRQVLEEELGKP